MMALAWILRALRGVLIAIFAIMALTYGCRAHGQTTNDLIVPEIMDVGSPRAVSGLYLVDDTYNGQTQYWCSARGFHMSYVASGEGWMINQSGVDAVLSQKSDGLAVDADVTWHDSDTPANTVSGHPYFWSAGVTNSTNWFNAWSTQAVQVVTQSIVTVTQQLVIVIENLGDLLDAAVTVSNLLAGVPDAVGDIGNIRDDTDDSAYHLHELASWGTPFTGSGIRVQLASMDFELGGFSGESYGGGSAPSGPMPDYPETMSTNYSKGLYEATTNQDLTNDVGGAMSDPVDWGTIAPSNVLGGLGRSPTFAVIDIPWTDIITNASPSSGNITFTLDWLKLNSDPEVWDGVRSFWTIMILCMFGFWCFNVYRTMG